MKHKLARGASDVDPGGGSARHRGTPTTAAALTAPLAASLS